MRFALFSVAVLCLLLGLSRITASAAVIVDGATAQINKNGDGMPCFGSEESLHQFLDATNNHDKYGEIEALQDAVFLQPGLRVRAIQHKGSLASEVRLRIERLLD